MEKAGFTSEDDTETVEKVVKPKEVAFETIGKSTLVCQNESGSGKYLGTKEVASVVLKFTGCELSGSKCSSAGAAAGEIVTDTLEGALGYHEKEANSVALDLVGAGEEEQFLEATCGSATVKVRGSAIAAIGAPNKMSSSFALRFKQKKGKQAIGHFEGETEDDVLEMAIANVGFGAYDQTGLTLEASLSNEEEVEINTVA